MGSKNSAVAQQCRNQQKFSCFHNFKANQKPDKNQQNSDSPGQICVSPAGKTAKRHKKRPEPQPKNAGGWTISKIDDTPLEIEGDVFVTDT